MKKLIGLILILATMARGSDLAIDSASSQIQDGQRLSAAQLKALVNNATIQNSFYSGKSVYAAVNGGDTLLILSLATSPAQFQRTTPSQLFLNNPQLITGQGLKTTPVGGDTILIYDSVGLTLSSTAFSNLWGVIASIPASSVNFSNTITAYTNVYFPLNPNNTLYTLVWDTNGLPKYLTYSNFEAGLISDIFTNQGVALNWQSTWTPWTVYGTNSMTNAWGQPGQFGITNLFHTNIITPTLTLTDNVPVQAFNQSGSNTVATLGAIEQLFFSNPGIVPYSVARLQFQGTPLILTLTNLWDLTHNQINYQSNTYLVAGNIYCISFQKDPTSAKIIPVPAAQTNQNFYIVPVATNASYALIYTNYITALNGSGNVIFTNNNTAGSAVNLHNILVMTNLVSVNADAMQVISGVQTIRPGVYDVCFRTNFLNANYYVTGSAMEAASNSGAYFMLNADNVVQTNKVRISVQGSAGVYTNSPRVEAIIQPQ